MPSGRKLTYPFDELTKDGKTVTIPAYNYLRRNAIGAAARAYAARKGFRVTVVRDGAEVVITRVACLEVQ